MTTTNHIDCSINRDDWESMLRAEFARITREAFHGASVLPNANVMEELANGDTLAIACDHDAATTYRYGMHGPYVEVCANCNESTVYVDQDEWNSDGNKTEAEFVKWHRCS